MMQQQSLSEFMQYLVATLHKGDLKMPLKDERPWHSLFYELKRTDLDNKPAFLSKLRFDWDGPYPKCQEVAELLHALHWNAGVTGLNPHYEEMKLPEDIAKHWEQRLTDLPDEDRTTFDRILELARQQFAPC